MAERYDKTCLCQGRQHMGQQITPAQPGCVLWGVITGAPVSGRGGCVDQPSYRPPRTLRHPAFVAAMCHIMQQRVHVGCHDVRIGGQIPSGIEPAIRVVPGPPSCAMVMGYRVLIAQIRDGVAVECPVDIVRDRRQSGRAIAVGRGAVWSGHDSGFELPPRTMQWRRCGIQPAVSASRYANRPT